MLDDTVRISSSKFVVLEWVESKTLSDLEQKMLKETSFREEKNLVRMMLILLSELRQLHSHGILHRDIKLENILWMEKNALLCFIFIDFGISHKFGSGEKIMVSRDDFKPAEINTEREGFHSDIYSLGKVFQEVLRINSKEMRASSSLCELMEDMASEDIEKRPNTENCIDRILSFAFFKQQHRSLDVYPFLSAGKPFPQECLCKDFEKMRGEIVQEQKKVHADKNSLFHSIEDMDSTSFSLKEMEEMRNKYEREKEEREKQLERVERQKKEAEAKIDELMRQIEQMRKAGN